jgi:dihydroorotase
VGDDLKHPSKLRHESHIHHSIGLVKHKRFDLLSRQFLLKIDLHEAAWSCYHDVYAALDRLDLFLRPDTSVQGHKSQIGMLRELAGLMEYLDNQFLCRHQDQCTWPAILAILHFHQQGEQVGSRFTRTGLRDADHLLPSEDHRDAFLLNGSWLSKAQVSNCRQQLFVELESSPSRFHHNTSIFTGMKSTLILNAKIVNEGQVLEGDVMLKGERIQKVGTGLQSLEADETIDANGKYLFPGAIDDQVHFREPGLTHKANISTESRAAVAGGVTSFMEMPNTVPPVFTQALLAQKYAIAAKTSLANYSFFMGASNDNLDEVMKTDVTKVCGLKIFMGSSTGNLLVDDPKTLEGFYSRFPSIIATHCEDENTIRTNLEKAKEKYGEAVPIAEHPTIRSEEGCWKSSSFAVGLARKHGTRLHILHISTARETELFDKGPVEQKKITAEACIHHLWFSDQDYGRLGNLIKWNPAIKSPADREGIWKALLDDRIDVVATDHAPHTIQEKKASYLKAPSGGPLVQHSLVAMMEFHRQGKISIENIARKMCHAPAILFRVRERGFIREGYLADLVLVDPASPWTVDWSNIKAKCGWSPFEGQKFQSRVTHTWVNGHLVYEVGKIIEGRMGQRLVFDN